jgi:hypothetical protein
LKAGFIWGVVTFVLSFLLILLVLSGLAIDIDVLRWPIALALVALGLLRSRLVPRIVGWLAGAWSAAIALREVVPWITLQRVGKATALSVAPTVVGVLFLLVLGATALAGSNKRPQAR